MVNKAFSDFADLIAPFHGLLKSIRVSGVALNVNGGWFNIALCMECRESELKDRMVAFADRQLLYYAVDYPLGAMNDLIGGVEANGFFTLDARESGAEPVTRIFLSRHASNSQEALSRISWYGASILHADDRATGHSGRTRVHFGAYGERFEELLDPSLKRRLDSALRLGNPVYDGLNDLFTRLMPVAKYSADQQTYVGIHCELPFEIDPQGDGRVRIRAYSGIGESSLKLVCFYDTAKSVAPSTNVFRSSDSASGEGGWLEWVSDLDWPAGCERARVILFYNDQEVRTLRLNRWLKKAHLGIVVDDYFDQDRVLLREALLGPRVRQQQEQFESGIARLMNLLGIPVVLYRDGAEKAKPDLGAYLGEQNVAVMGECTLEKPLEKVSMLAERSRHLRNLLPGDCAIRSVVFTKAQTSPSERQQAAEHDVVLVGHEEIKTLLTYLETETNANKVLEYFKSLLLRVSAESLGLYGTW